MASLAESLRKEDSKEFSDVTVFVGGINFACHMVILSARSKFFNRAFRTDMKERTGRRIELVGISSRVFEILLDYIYHDEDILTADNFFDVLMAADYLQIDSLLDKGRQFLNTRFSLNNCGRVYRISQVCRWKDLEKSAWSLLERNFDKLGLKELDVLSHTEMSCLVKSNRLVTESEDFVMEKILQWVSLGTDGSPDHRSENGNQRLKVLGALLESCRYFLISTNFLWETLDQNHFLQASQSCCDLVKAISRHKTQLDTHHYGCLLPECHRDADSVKNVILVVSDSTLRARRIARKVEGRSSQINLKFSPDLFQFSGGTFYNGTTYFEGHDQNMTKRRIYEYDVIQNTVTCCNESENSHGNATLSFLPIGESLVALRRSGVDSGFFFIECMRLPCKPSYKWTKLGSPSTRAMQVECVSSINSKLLIFWKNSNSRSLTVECYDVGHRKSYVLQQQLSPSSASVKTFRKGSMVYALQGDGMLWKVKPLERPPYVEFCKVARLWEGQEELRAVVIALDNLLVYRSRPEPFRDIQWLCHNCSLRDVFIQTFGMSMKGVSTNIFHTLLDKGLVV